MQNDAIITLQIQGISAETLLQKLDSLESKISKLEDQSQNPSEKLLNREETAKILGISLVTLHSWVKQNILKAYRIGNKVRFKEHEVMASLVQINSKR